MNPAAELADWLRLLGTEGVGRETARRLLAAFGSASQVFESEGAARRALVTEAQAQSLERRPAGLDSWHAGTLAWLSTDDGAPRRVVTLGDPQYPDSLLHTADPPLLLYAQGRLELLKAASIAIVGSRHPTTQGAENARAFGRELSVSGLTIVSGLALGIDGAAHEGGLEGGASTISVVGTGLDRVYPSRHRDLAHRIAAKGLMLSEFALGTPALAANFPQRNRIIAGLSRGTLVVEATVQSGSLITARVANEAGREVFAIPGSIHAPQSRGCHALIRQGAKLVETARDVLEELNLATPATAAIAAESVAPSPPDSLMDALGHDPVTLDALSARTGWSTADLNLRLLELELEGQVARLPGQLIQRLVRV